MKVDFCPVLCYPESGYFTGFLGHQSFCLVQEDDGYYFSADSWFTIGIRVTIYRDFKCDISELDYDF